MSTPAIAVERRRVRPGAMAASFGALAIATVVVWSGWGGSDVSTAVSDGAAVIASLGGAVVVLRSALGRERDRLPWLLLGVAMLLWGAGETLWTWFEVGRGREVPFPSLADAAYLGAVPVAMAALLVFARMERAAFQLRTALDGVVLTGSLLFVAWALVLGPAWRASETSWFDHAVTVAYPVTDLALAAVALLVVQWGRVADRTSIRIVGAALVVMAVADSAFTWLTTTGTYSSSNPITMMWPLAYLMIAFATTHRDERRGPHRPEGTVGRAALLMPYVPLLAAMAVGGPRLIAGRPFGPFLAIDGLVVILAVVIRQAIVTADLSAAVAALNEREGDLRRMATRDPLTGLPNRTSFGTSLALAARSGGTPPAVVFIDLDGFKAVNDCFGHAAGDDLLVEASRRLEACATGGMEVARLGGDEFVVLVPDGEQAAVQLANRILDSFQIPMERDGERIPFRASLGVATAPVDGDPAEAVRRADAAMYVAKTSGRGGLVVHPVEPATPVADPPPVS